MPRDNDHKFPARRFFNFPFLEDELDPMGTSGLSVFEDKKHVCVEADLPGLKPEDVEVTFEKGMLLIRGERAEEQKDPDKKYYRKSSHAFSYQVQVPGTIDEKDEPEAIYNNGVMKISFRKSEASHAKKINVKTK